VENLYLIGVRTQYRFAVILGNYIIGTVMAGILEPGCLRKAVFAVMRQKDPALSLLTVLHYQVLIG
jgi:hypothetical protein